MCHPIFPLVKQPTPSTKGAKDLGPKERQTLAVQALAKTTSITNLAENLQVSRKFVYQQTGTAQQALQKAFLPEAREDQVLFHLPVTKAWLRQLMLGLTLICHSSQRGIVELLRDLFDYPIALGTVHQVLQQAVLPARLYNSRQDLRAVRFGAHDEIFQCRRPVLVGADVASTYCYLLSQEEHRDADTWAVRLLELQERGFAPEATIADACHGLRAGQRAALGDVPCWGDVFHGLQDLTALASLLETRAYEALAACAGLEQCRQRVQQRGQTTRSLGQKLRLAHVAENRAVTLADDVALLLRWLRDDILALAGPERSHRRALYDFVVAELEAREPLCSSLGPVRRSLQRQRDNLLAFAAHLDQRLQALAQKFQLPNDRVRELLHCLALDHRQPQRWQQETRLRHRLRERFHPLQKAVAQLLRDTVRASSVIENLNSRLRNYFFLRRFLGPDYLALLQFFLNHRRFLRSQRPERVGKSPAELLTGQAHRHWLELLGYTRFTRT